MANATLVGLSPQVRGKRWVLEKDHYTVGRIEESSDLCILDSTVSSRHAVLELTGEGFKLIDQQSTNGTRVNGVAIQEQLLHNGDIVQFGSVELMYKTMNAEQTVSKTIISLADHSNAGQTVRQMTNISPVVEESNKMTTALFAAIGVVLGGAILLVLIMILKNLF